MALYAFNGTWNSEKTDDAATPDDEGIGNTNVVRFKRAYGGAVGYYCNGIGTRVGLVGKVVGGAFGVGGQHRLLEAIAALRQRTAEGDRNIDIVGFSRGAALALSFANRVARTTGPDGKPMRIRFLGLFDVVGSFGIPINVGVFRFQEYNFGYELALPRNVDYCFHAMALDEPRQTFRVTRLLGAYEVWFRGSHSDVGGGNGNTGLNNIPLCWMLQKARACGVPIVESHVLDAKNGCVPTSRVIHALDLRRDPFRTIAKTDRIHYTVVVPSGSTDCCDPPSECRRETPDLASAAERSSIA